MLAEFLDENGANRSHRKAIPYYGSIPMLVILAGLPGTGKTTIARELATRLGAIVLNKDDIRAALFPPAVLEYSREQDDFVVDIMLQAARYLLRPGGQRIVALDGRPFSRRPQIDDVIAFAERIPTAWRILEFTCSEETARKRLETSRAQHPAQNRDFDLYQRIKQDFTPIRRAKAIIDTEMPLETCVQASIAALQAPRAQASPSGAGNS